MNAKLNVPANAAASRQGRERTAKVLPRSEPSLAHHSAFAGTKCRLDLHANDRTSDTNSRVIHRTHRLGSGPEDTPFVRSRRRSQNERKQDEDDPTPHGCSMPEVV
jgi:hypothetical protein